MAPRKKQSQRLAVSTGADTATGATADYARKLRKKDLKASSKGKSTEERRLEEEIFGLDYSAVSDDDGERVVSSTLGWLDQKRTEKLREQGLEDNDYSNPEPNELDHLADDELFAIDEPRASTSKILDQPARSDVTASDSEQSDEDEEDDVEEEQEYQENNDTTFEDQSRNAAKTSVYTSLKGKAPAKRAPLWTDDADQGVSISLQGNKRLRKLRDQAGEDVVSGSDYERKLRQQFQKIHPAPSWATKARASRTAKGSDSEDDEQSFNDSEAHVPDDSVRALQKILRNSAAGLKNGQRLQRPLPSGELDMQRLRDANQVERDTKSAITALEFHPSAQVLFTTSEDRRLKLYQIDGTVNPLLQSIHTPDLPITSAGFHPSGSSILLTGRRPFFFSYDLQSGRVIRSPRGLWSGGLGGSDGATNDKLGGSMQTFSFSPDGRYVAVAGRRGYVHLLDWGLDGKGLMAGGNGGQSVGHVKVNSGIHGLAWRANGAELVTIGDDASIYSWDIGSRRCIQRWHDDGGFAPSCAATDRQERFFAVGSRSGIVNLYDAPKAFAPELAETTARKPVKTVMNLTTSVSTIRFNKTSELMAIASSSKKDSLKMVHLPSMSVISNWPTAGTPLGQVSDVAFSKGSEYMAIGNHRGRVLLYSIYHYL